MLIVYLLSRVCLRCIRWFVCLQPTHLFDVWWRYILFSSNYHDQIGSMRNFWSRSWSNGTCSIFLIILIDELIHRLWNIFVFRWRLVHHQAWLITLHITGSLTPIPNHKAIKSDKPIDNRLHNNSYISIKFRVDDDNLLLEWRPSAVRAPTIMYASAAAMLTQL